jgi:hypothetical protein
MISSPKRDNEARSIGGSANTLELPWLTIGAISEEPSKSL